MARKHVSLRISDTSDADIRALSKEYGIPYAVVLRVCVAVGFTHLPEIRKHLETIKKGQ
jgi:hypothetical protein